MEVKDLIDIQDDACDVQMVGRIVEIYSKKKSFFEEGQVAPNKEGNASLIKKIRSAKIINLTHIKNVGLIFNAAAIIGFNSTAPLDTAYMVNIASAKLKRYDMRIQASFKVSFFAML